MEYKIEKKEKSIVQIEIKLNATEWEKEVEEAYNRTRGKYNIEGFRKGKAPRKVIEKMYGNGVFYEDALSEGFYNAYMQILNKEPKLEPVDAPNLSVKSMDSNGVVLVADVVVRPDVKVNKYKGFGVSVREAKVTDEMVNHELEHAREHNARLVETAGSIAMGDIANINFEGSVNGKVFEGGTAENYDLEIGSHSFIDNFEDQLIGLKAGDNKDVKVTFPKEYHVKDLAGKPAVFKVKVNTVKQKQLPELNDEFASNVSDFETLKEYKEDLKQHMLEHEKEHSKVDAENEILDKIVENTEVEVPNQMVESELDNLMKDLEYRLMYQGLNLETYAGYLNTTVEKLRAERKADALKSVKIRLALTYILEKEKIEVTDAEVNEKVKEMAKSAKKTVKEFKETMPAERINYIKNDILMNKLLTFLLENNTSKTASKTTAKKETAPAQKKTTTKSASAQKKTTKK